MKKQVFIPSGFTTMRIVTAKFKKEGEAMEIAYILRFPLSQAPKGADVVAQPDITQTVTQFSHKAHQHLCAAMNRLKFHFLFLTDILDIEEYSGEGGRAVYDLLNTAYDYQPDFIKTLLESTVINGYSIKGDPEQETEGIVIMGGKITRMGHYMAVNTPFLALAPNETQKQYPFMEDLNRSLAIIDDEMRQYMDGKRWSDGQLDLFEATKVTLDQPKKKLWDDLPSNVEPEEYMDVHSFNTIKTGTND